MATTTKASKPIRMPTSTRYEFFEPIGTGGAGTVFRGRDRITNTPVAIKVLRAALTESPNQHYRFAQEFRAATRLEHPNIVRALDFGTDGTLSFLVYDLVDGQSLGEKIEKASGMGPLGEAEGSFRRLVFGELVRVGPENSDGILVKIQPAGEVA